MKRPENLTKLYYSIGEVAKMFNVSSSLLRYWESEFSVLKVKKNRKGDRQYMVKDIEKLVEIYTLLKDRGFTIEGAKKELKNSKGIDTTMPLKDNNALKTKLEHIRSGLTDLLKNLE